jgi:hypothetical protein
MNTNAREPQSPESYSTFWEPVAAPAPAPAATAVAEQPKDAYLEFTEVTEGVPAARRGDRT